MDRKMAISVMVKLIDKITAPFKQIEAVIGRLTGPLDRLKGMFSAIGDRVRNLTGRIGVMANKIGAMGTLGAGLAFVAPLKAAASFESVLRDIGITAGLSGTALDDMIKGTGPAMQKLALEVGQRSMALLEGLRSLVASGLDLPTGVDLMRTIGRVATAAGAEVVDVSRSAFSLTSNLKITVAEMEEALGMLVTAGKLGRFEFRDMAKYLPELTAGIQKFGLYGKEAVATLGAATQIGMFGTSDPSIAANNLKNVFQKFFQKDVIKNFKEEAGINITEVIQTAPFFNKNPFEAALEALLSAIKVSGDEVQKIYDTATKGGMAPVEALEKVREHIERVGGAERMQRIFGDLQALDWLGAYLANRKKYEEFKRDILKGGADIIGTDFISRMAGLEAKLLHFTETAEQAMTRIGAAYARHLKPAGDVLDNLMKGIERFDKWLPVVGDDILFFAGGALLAVTAVGLLGGVVAGIAVIGAPVAAVLVGIAAVALVIMRYWEPLKAFFEERLNGIKEGWKDLVASVSTWWHGLVENLKADFSGFADWIARRWEDAFPKWLRSFLSGAAFALPGAALSAVPGAGFAASATKFASPGRNGFAPVPAAAAQPEQKVGGEVRIKYDGPGRIESVESYSRDVPLTVDRGLMLGMP